MKNIPSQVIADEIIEKSPYADELIFLEDRLLREATLLLRQRIANKIEDYREELRRDASPICFVQAEGLDTDGDIHNLDKFCYGLSKVEMQRFPTRDEASYWTDLLSMYYQEFGKSINPRYVVLYPPGRSLHLIVSLQISLGNKYASEKQTEESGLARTLALNAVGNSEELDMEETANQRLNGKAHLLLAETEHDLGGRKDRVERSMVIAVKQINSACMGGSNLKDSVALAHLYTQSAVLASEGFDFGLSVEDAVVQASTYINEARSRTTDSDANFRKILEKDRRKLAEISGSAACRV